MRQPSSHTEGLDDRSPSIVLILRHVHEAAYRIDDRLSVAPRHVFFCIYLTFFKPGIYIYNSNPLFNQVGKLRTSSHLQLRPGQDKAKQCDTDNNTELHME